MELIDGEAPDEKLFDFAPAVTRIAFEHDSIAFWRGENRKGSTFIRRGLPGNASAA
jgi:hypothetical protein